jgi:hypothetical protein
MKAIKNFFGSVKGKLSRMRTSLTRVNEKEPLSKLSLVVIIFLDIFILSTLFKGIEEHANQLTSPDEYIPTICRDIVIQDSGEKAEKLNRLENTTLYYHRNYSLIEEYKRRDLHPICMKFIDIIEPTIKNSEIIHLFETRERLYQKYSETEKELNKLKSSYDTYLLEKISGESKPKKSNISAIKLNLIQKREQLNGIVGQINSVESRINSNTDIVGILDNIEKLKSDYREELKSDIKNLNFWYPVKRLLMQLIFLLPLFLLFYFWYSRSIKKGLGLQTLISSHLLVITFIPIFLKISEAIYDIIPKKLLKALWELLISLKLVALWHYLIIIISIGIAILCIYTIQKKLFSREKLIEKRITKGCCLNCGKKIPLNAQACPLCGFKQYSKCSNCGEETYIYGKFCKECGVESDQQM